MTHAQEPRRTRAGTTGKGNGAGEGRDLFLDTAATLEIKQFPPIKYIVEGYLVEGATLLAGRPKIGKSWLALDCALAVSSGGTCLGVYCKEGDVMFIALEDDERRIRERIEKILGRRGWPARFAYKTEWPRANEGGLDKIRTWIKFTGAPRLIVINPHSPDGA